MKRPITDRNVTVVIPAYNAAETINGALASVLGQSVPANEVIIADDASTDDTVEIAKRWLDLLPLRIIERSENGGVGEARASAINAASNDILAPLDADDVWLPDHLELTVPLLTDESVIVGTRPVRWAPGLGIDTSGVGVPPGVPAVADQVRETLLSNFLFVGSLYSKRALDRAGGPGLRSSVEDWDGWIRLVVLEGCRAVASPHATVLYRSRIDSVSAGEACLPAEVELLKSMLSNPAFRDYEDLISESIRRRSARSMFLEAVALSSAGTTGGARRAYLRAFMQDRTIRGGAGPGSQGSVAIRSMIGLLSPGLVRMLRDRRLKHKRVIQPELSVETFKVDQRSNQSGIV